MSVRGAIALTSGVRVCYTRVLNATEHRDQLIAIPGAIRSVRMESARLPRRLLPDIVRLRASVEGYRTAFSFIHDTGEIESIDARSLYLRACAIAAHLHRSHLTGRRGLLLYAPGLEFICAFVGAMLAGVVAVPVMPPTV